MNKTGKAIISVIAALLSVSLLAACGGSMSGSNSGPPPTTMVATTAAAMQAGPQGGFTDYALETGKAAEFDEEGFYVADNAQYDEGDSMEPDGGLSLEVVYTSVNLSEKIIHTVFAQIETIDFDDSVERINAMMEAYDAFVESSYVGGRNYTQSFYGYQTYRTAQFVLRVPKNALTEMEKNLETLGNVTSLTRNAENITAQFLDTESRLKSYRTQESRLLDMLEKCETVAEMIEIEKSLSELRYQIESLTSTLQNWQNRVDYSTLTINLNEVAMLSESIPVQRTYWQRVSDETLVSLRSVGDFFLNLFTFLITNSPILIALAIGVVIVIVIVRRISRRRKRQNPYGKGRVNKGNYRKYGKVGYDNNDNYGNYGDYNNYFNHLGAYDSTGGADGAGGEGCEDGAGGAGGAGGMSGAGGASGAGGMSGAGGTDGADGISGTSSSDGKGN
ncbi:MAG: DUF4349 domain-containing protein [Oscillospiraceae bacterium]|nr:DUF4349 domain-containing protein [Oscillospiraceae bacterium]